MDRWSMCTLNVHYTLQNTPIEIKGSQGRVTYRVTPLDSLKRSGAILYIEEKS